MSKYTPFGEFLSKQPGDVVRLSFREIERTLGFKLPHSAYDQRAWWSNNINNNVMTRVWKRAGFYTRDVDMKNHQAVFERQKKTSTAVETIERMMKEDIERSSTRRHKGTAGHPIRGALKGVLRLVGGTDLTKPADPNWGRD